MSGLTRVLGPVVQFLVLPVFYPFEYLFLRRSLAVELVGDDHPWRNALSLEQLAQKLLSSSFISAALHQDIYTCCLLGPLLATGNTSCLWL
ncbi:MAG TPA: hypothetical protein V6D03_08165 [Candidatus Caenarcaniphilales bacterium]